MKYQEPGRPIKVAIADDHALFRAGVKTALSVKKDVELIAEADNGMQLINLLKHIEPDVILLDIQMPIMDGIQLRQRLTENDYLRKKSTPFVFLTTASNPELVRMAYDQTVQGFFTKASSFAGLKTQVSLVVSYWQACQHPLLDEYVA